MKNFSLLLLEGVKNSVLNFYGKIKQARVNLNVFRPLLNSKEVLLLLSSFLLVYSSYSQTLSFTKANPQPNLMESYGGTFASGDIDGDGDIDLFMTGLTPQIQTKLYLNDGTGNFTEVPHNFPRSGSSQVIFKDLDGDGDLDLFFSGSNQLNQTFTHIYRNNGSGVFTQVPNPGLPNIRRGAAIADVDNDGDQDIVITGGPGVSGVYLNNGNAVFTPQGNSPFAAVSGVIAFIDIENDGDQDVVISGNASIKLYQNNGSGIFTVNNNSTFAALNGEDIDVADIDDDGDLDFLVNGSTQNLLYINNGSGVFTQITTLFQATNGGANAIADLDNDGYQDVLIVGTQAGGLPHIYNILYRNMGNNMFIPVDTLGGEYIADCVVADFTGDGFNDIIIQGFAYKTNVYWNTTTTVSTSNPISSNETVVFYPNPTSGSVNFSLDENVESVSVFNSFGQEVLSKQVNRKEFVLDVSDLPNGIYIVKLNAIKPKTIKLIKY